MSTQTERYQSVFRAGIQGQSVAVKRGAASIARYVRLLATTPPFETRAEAEMAAAELALTEALLAVKLSIVEYANRPKTEPTQTVTEELSRVAAI